MPKIVWISYQWEAGEDKGFGLSALDSLRGNGQNLEHPSLDDLAAAMHYFKKDICERTGVDMEQIRILPMGVWTGKRRWEWLDIPTYFVKWGVPLAGMLIAAFLIYKYPTPSSVALTGFVEKQVHRIM